MIEREWTKSTRSGGQGDCVEVYVDGDAAAFRDSKNPQGGIVALPRETLAAFIEDVKAGRFNR